MSSSRGVRERGLRGTVISLLAVATLLCAVGAGLFLANEPGTGGATRAAAPGPTDLNGNPVEFDAGEEAPLGAEPEHGAGTVLGRFSIATVGLDVPLRETTVVDDVVTPPGFASAYALSNYGADLEHAGSGTVYIAMHSLRGGGVGPGNYLFDPATGAPLAETGDLVRAGARSYRVTGSMTVSKSQLSGASSVWSQKPGTLVVITCLQTPSGKPSSANFVLTAALVR